MLPVASVAYRADDAITPGRRTTQSTFERLVNAQKYEVAWGTVESWYKHGL